MDETFCVAYPLCRSCEDGCRTRLLDGGSAIRVGPVHRGNLRRRLLGVFPRRPVPRARMPGDRKNRTLLEVGGDSRHDVPVEVSINEPIGADRDVAVGDRSLRVGTLEDIVAEKLRAYLQQKGEIRNRNRRQDLLDIAHILQTGAPLDLDSVSQYLLEKAWARDVPVSKAAFRDPELADCARREYDDLKATVREGFVTFEEALKSLFTLVEKLAIPAH